MNTYISILKPARAALIVFALFVAGAFAAVAGLIQYRNEVEQTILLNEKRLGNAKNDITKLTYDLGSINRLASKYQHLKQLGFVGEPDRDAWVQRLEAIYRDTRLPPTLRYTLAPPQLVNPQQIAADSPLIYQKNVYYHDLAMELSNIHEGELLDFIDKLNGSWRAPFRVETCQITREGENEPITGLQIKCTLRLFSMPVPMKAP